MSPEKQPNIIGKVVETARSLVRGYSAEDLLRARRIAGGDIIPEDRARFKNEQLAVAQAAVLGVSIQASSLSPLMGGPHLPYDMAAVIEQASSIENLPDEQVDTTLKQQALGNLIRWKQPISLQSH